MYKYIYCICIGNYFNTTFKDGLGCRTKDLLNPLGKHRGFATFKHETFFMDLLPLWVGGLQASS